MGGHPLWPNELIADENQLDVWNRCRNDSTVFSDLTSGESEFQSTIVLGKNENLYALTQEDRGMNVVSSARLV